LLALGREAALNQPSRAFQTNRINRLRRLRPALYVAWYKIKEPKKEMA
jgi:hypothetical protein